MPNDRMLYKAPGPHAIHGGNFDYIIVDEDNVQAFEDALTNGWFKTTDEAKAGFVSEQTKEAASVDANGVTVSVPPAPVKPKKAEKAW